MGECSRRRGGKCKFRHLTQREYEQEIYGTSHRDIDQGTNHYEHSVNPDLLGNLGPPDPKRHRLEPKLLPIDFQREGEFIIPIEEIGRDILGREISLREFRERERDKELDRRGLEEILLLRKQMDNLKKENASLKKEVSDLRATNEFLLDQVSHLVPFVMFLQG